MVAKFRTYFVGIKISLTNLFLEVIEMLTYKKNYNWQPYTDQLFLKDPLEKQLVYSPNE